MATDESIRDSLRLAEAWEMKAQPTWVAKCLSSALMGYISIAVTEKESCSHGTSWLADRGFIAVLEKYYATLTVLITYVTDGRLPTSAIAGNYHSLVFAHAAWCMKKYELGESFARFSLLKYVSELSTPFWQEYSKGISSLMDQKPFQAKKMRLKGQERYWSSYIRLIETARNGGNIESAVADIDALFTIRNNDKNDRDDYYQIEGSIDKSALWDFRKEGLLNYIRSANSTCPADLGQYSCGH